MPVTARSLRERILDEAISILGRDGGSGLTVRAVAKASDCSTMGVYTHFNGKPGLVDAIVAEGFAGADEAASAAADSARDARERLLRATEAFGAWAFAHPTQYQVMMTPCMPGYQPGPDARHADAVSFGRHRDRVADAVAEGVLGGESDDVDAMAVHLWATVHGHIVLSLRASSPSAEDCLVNLRESIAWAIAGLDAAVR